MGSLRDSLSALERRGDKHALRLVDGTPLEGWILSVDETSLRFLPAPTPFEPDGDACTIPLASVDPVSLAYWDGSAWVPFPPDRASQP